MTEHDALQLATHAARQSPCAKSQRGVLIWHPENPLSFMGWNHPPAPFKCDGSEACRAACGKLCIHAEAHAVLGIARVVRRGHYRNDFLDGAEMLHVKVVDGLAVPSGPPSCWQCSRLILESKIAGMWLLHEDGLRRYGAEEFHRLTLEHCGLPIIEEIP